MEGRLSKGDQGVQVRELRDILVRLGLLEDSSSELFDGDVEHAVRSFQQGRGLVADGVCGSHTMRALDEARWRLGDRVIKESTPMMRGDDVALLQTRLMEMGFDLGRVDGIFGPRSVAALAAFQKSVGIRVDGSCGPETFVALRRLQRTVTGGAAAHLRERAVLARRGPALSGKRIVIDPGHGGADLGVESFDLAESEIVLDIAERIEGRLGALGVAVYLTRSGQNPGPTERMGDTARADFANQSGADLFISIHLDGNSSREASGVATYYYGNDAHGAHSVVGERLAEIMQREISARTNLKNCRTHQKTWELLRHTRMPAVRVDCGYLTNPQNAQWLGQASFREVLAEAISISVQRLYLPEEGDADTGVLTLADLRKK